jgi:hypothetical protein
MYSHTYLLLKIKLRKQKEFRPLGGTLPENSFITKTMYKVKNKISFSKFWGKYF